MICRRLPRIKIVNAEAFNSRIKHVWNYILYMKQIVDELLDEKIISRDDAYSLCLADDTAAWVCGRISTANYVTFRMSLINSTNSRMNASALSSLLRQNGFEESFEQQLQILFPHGHNRTRYYMFSKFDDIVAINLIVSCLNDTIEFSNPCPQLSYFIHVNRDNLPDDTKTDLNFSQYFAATTRDCDCLRTTQDADKIQLLFDKQFNINDQFYYRHMYTMWDLIEDVHDEGFVSIECDCNSNDHSLLHKYTSSYDTSKLENYAKAKHICELCYMSRDDLHV